jgi:hypothetical protein
VGSCLGGGGFGLYFGTLMGVIPAQKAGMAIVLLLWLPLLPLGAVLEQPVAAGVAAGSTGRGAWRGDVAAAALALAGQMSALSAGLRDVGLGYSIVGGGCSAAGCWGGGPIS